MFPSLGLFSLLVSTVLGQGSNGTGGGYGTNGGYELKTGPLDSAWTNKVGLNPWPEYPRPQRARSEWKNLNGVWQYRNATEGHAELDDPPFGTELEESILVPFCIESALSGIMRGNAAYSWYRTTFDVPSHWRDHVLLNFGAVDYEATVFVNGKKATTHHGGYFAFEVDITDYLNGYGSNELVVFVYDPTNSDGTNIPTGKQKLVPEHIFYTPCSGIWQTVWIESAPATWIKQLDISAGADGTVNITVHTSSNETSSAEVTIYEPDSENINLQTKVPVNEVYTLKVNSPSLWAPDHPTLYNITVTLGSDTVQSYTGFRTISQGLVNGIQRPLLNGEFIFWFGTLDQGYWPDGLHSPPSREAMVFDLNTLKEVGYNMVRKHIKIEPALFYYACDLLGLMVMQDMPSLAFGPPDEDNPAQREYNRELELMVEQHKSYPSIVSWVIYNEGWGQTSNNGSLDYILTDLVRKHDPTRLIDSVTGWYDHGAGDFHDNHHYSSPQCGTPWYSAASTPYDNRRIAIQGEFGGIGQNVTEEHAWKVPASIHDIVHTYELDATVEVWNLRAHMIFKELEFQIKEYACSGAVWTQTTDVEGEVNGMLTYDRRVNRMDKEQWKADIQALYDAAAARGKV